MPLSCCKVYSKCIPASACDSILMSSCWQLDFSSTPPPAVRTRSGSQSLAAETFANEEPSVCLLEVLPARPVITLHTAGVRQRREVPILQHIKRHHPGQPGPSPVGNQSQRTRGGAPLPSPLKTTTRTSQCSGTFSLSSHCCLPPPPPPPPPGGNSEVLLCASWCFCSKTKHTQD